MLAYEVTGCTLMMTSVTASNENSGVRVAPSSVRNHRCLEAELHRCSTDVRFGSTRPQISVDHLLMPTKASSSSSHADVVSALRVDGQRGGQLQARPDVAGTISNHFLPICLIAAVACESDLLFLCS